ncbi:MAG: rRNA maturation RNase YbeY [Bacilli bacterium]|nr:rRNA maturation RNase YbeY [Bacilli bacterium]
MNNIEFFNNTNTNIDEIDEVKKVIDYAVKKEKLENISFNIIIVDNEYIHNLNKEYRNIDRETDVITFALEDDDSIIVGDEVRVLGDIYISIDKAREQAKEYNHSLKRELSFLAVHGFYHLLGYDHETKEEEEVMFKKQEAVLDECGIKR